jgi:K+-transporting ATPase A subunit
MPQNLNAYTEVTTLEGGKQVIAQGQVASQEVIKMMGTNGAAASSMPIRRILTRTRTRSPISWRWC